MISSLLGKKIGMTQVYDAQNVLVPVTVVEAGPCAVVQVKTAETDGYNAVQIGFSRKKEKNSSKAELAHAKKAGVDHAPRVLSEVRLAASPALKVGDVVTVSAFQEGQLFHRRIGSIGMRQTPGRSWKNQSMPGHMGSERRTVQNLRVVKVIADKNLLLVKGAIPGANGDDVLVRLAIKGQQTKA